MANPKGRNRKKFAGEILRGAAGSVFSHYYREHALQNIRGVDFFESTDKATGAITNTVEVYFEDQNAEPERWYWVDRNETEREETGFHKSWQKRDPNDFEEADDEQVAAQA